MTHLEIFGCYLAIGLVLAVATLGAGNFDGNKHVGPRTVVIVSLFWPVAIFVAFVCGLVVTFEESDA